MQDTYDQVWRRVRYAEAELQAALELGDKELIAEARKAVRAADRKHLTYVHLESIRRIQADAEWFDRVTA